MKTQVNCFLFYLFTGNSHGDCARKIRGSVGVEGEKAACSGYRFSELNKFQTKTLF
jgi:hypothetical protein